jgi:4-aminobutyrate aminotransferase-like enzyme
MSETLTERRARLMGPNVPTFYRKPVHITRASGVWLWDADGKRYLDCYNNVPHVGHCHPAVVAAIADQAAVLNTHTRYHHDLVLDYIEALTARLGHGVSQCIMTCTGSEANDIALRMAQAVTGKIGIIATDNTYHGNTTATSALSSRRPPIGGYPAHVRRVPAPDNLRAPAPDGSVFAAQIRAAIEDLNACGIGFSGMMLCPVFANEGIPTVAPGFFAKAEAVIRAAGGLILCDEVQPGFGRMGSHFWGHEWLGMTPDVVTCGKPMANGHPVAAVLARPDVMAAFRNAFGYFNTFGGNAVSAAACIATLQVIDDEGLQDNAARTSAYMMERLGMFFGAEFVLDAEHTPATAFVEDLVEVMVARGFILNRIGRAGNTLKIRPPLPFGVEHADMLVDALAEALAATPIPA